MMTTGIIEQKHRVVHAKFVIAEEDLWIETSNPFNEVTAVFLLNIPHYHIPMYVSTYVRMYVRRYVCMWLFGEAILIWTYRFRCSIPPYTCSVDLLSLCVCSECSFVHV